MKINILCLYSDIMNLYGDTGNVKVIKYHLDKQDIKYNIDYKSIDDTLDIKNYDLIITSQGTEENRRLCLKHLLKYKSDVKKYIEDNKFFLATGNSLGLFGKTLYGEEALNIFEFDTIETVQRVSKEIILENDICKPIYGFVNNSDNMENSKPSLFNEEGIKYKNFYGTTTLGPIFARNPEFLEYFLKELIRFKDKNFKFKDFDLALDEKAYNEFIEFKKTKVFNSHKA